MGEAERPPVRVVHLVWSLHCGGLETMLVDIANEQSSMADVYVIIGNDSHDPTILSHFNSGVTVKRLGRPVGSKNPWYITKLYAMLRLYRPDVIHAHHESFIRILQNLNVPKVLTVHTTGIKFSRFRNGYDAIYAISEAVKTDLLARYPDASIGVIHNGVQSSRINKKSKYGMRPFRLVQVSRLYHEQKGQDILLKAFARVKREINEEEITIDFIGEGPSKEFLMKLSRELGVDKWCNFLGQKNRDYIYHNLNTYDLLVQPSRHEGFGLTVIEAMAAKVPVLVSDIEGPMEIIENGSFGYNFHSEDDQDCAKQIINILNVSKKAGFEVEQDRNSKYVNSRFDVELTARNYLGEYAAVYSAKKTSGMK